MIFGSLSSTPPSNVRAIIGAPSVGGPHVWTGFPRHRQLLLKERLPCLPDQFEWLATSIRMTEGGAHVR
jgi:hypothetical protein